MGDLLHDPNLFHLNRHSTSVAFFIGLFLAFMPFPGQIFLAALGAFYFRCNLPIAVSLVFITNPFTFIFIYYGTYKLGARIMQLPPRDLSFELSWSWWQTEFLAIWQPFLLGCVLSGLLFGCMGYVCTQWFWRWNVIRKWKKRKQRRHTRVSQ